MMIKIGVIGCGKIAQFRHIPEYAANPNVQLVGFYDINQKRAADRVAQLCLPLGVRLGSAQVEEQLGRFASESAGLSLRRCWRRILTR